MKIEATPSGNMHLHHMITEPHFEVPPFDPRVDIRDEDMNWVIDRLNQLPHMPTKAHVARILSGMPHRTQITPLHNEVRIVPSGTQRPNWRIMTEMKSIAPGAAFAEVDKDEELLVFMNKHIEGFADDTSWFDGYSPSRTLNRLVALTAQRRLLFPTYGHNNLDILGQWEKSIVEKAKQTYMDSQWVKNSTIDFFDFLADLRIGMPELYARCAPRPDTYLRHAREALAYYSYHLDMHSYGALAHALCVMSADDIVITPEKFTLVFKDALSAPVQKPLPILKNF